MATPLPNQIQRPGGFDSTHQYLGTWSYNFLGSNFPANRGGAQDWYSWAKLQAPASLTKYEQWVVDQYKPWLASHPNDVIVGVANGNTGIYSVNMWSGLSKPVRSERMGTVEEYLAWAKIPQAEIDRRKLVAVQFQYLDWRSVFLDDAFNFFAERAPLGDPAFFYWVPPGPAGTGSQDGDLFRARNTRNDKPLGQKLFLDRFNYPATWFDNLIGGAIATVSLGALATGAVAATGAISVATAGTSIGTAVTGAAQSIGVPTSVLSAIPGGIGAISGAAVTAAATVGVTALAAKAAEGIKSATTPDTPKTVATAPPVLQLIPGGKKDAPFPWWLGLIFFL